MIQDCFGGNHASGSAAVVALYEKAAREFLRNRPPNACLLAALAVDPEHPGTLALQGFCNVLLARRETWLKAREIHEMLARHITASSSARDLVMKQALFACIEDEMPDAISILTDYVGEHPDDTVIVKIIHALQFLSGASSAMARFTAHVISRIDPKSDGYGYILGCHAFSLEENGEYRQAEELAQAAMNRDPRDLWSMHALAHVYEMNGRNREGIIWIESARDLWGEGGSFGYHLAWHLALFNLNLGKHERALAVYDRDVRPVPSEEFRDMANAVSLLCRIREDGVDIGDRFDDLAEISRRRSEDMTLIFASLHQLLALIECRDITAADKLVDHLVRKAAGQGQQCAVAANAGLPLALALLDGARNGPSVSMPGRVLRALPQIGGSHAQRDIFLRELAVMAARSGARSLLDNILALRHDMRCADRFTTLIENLVRKTSIVNQPGGLAA
jgi:tetratricopeptide (TPR) repeat protein